MKLFALYLAQFVVTFVGSVGGFYLGWWLGGHWFRCTCETCQSARGKKPCSL